MHPKATGGMPKSTHVLFLEEDIENKPFFEAARMMRKSMKESKNKKPNKFFLGELIYDGIRHEIWLGRQSITARKTDSELAGWLKIKALDLQP